MAVILGVLVVEIDMAGSGLVLETERRVRGPAVIRGEPGAAGWNKALLIGPAPSAGRADKTLNCSAFRTTPPPQAGREPAPAAATRKRKYSAI
jgi:hypothetical protein